ncbi:NAD-dependent epimerase/dehydratase family protein [Loktanella sp. DJP18]|uniref:NAD-dependent epimerase/dehydratase family protein n=1 Tax=Loktanella sp. DJP18 TaxID=3409788 RepID=UPI003BB4AD71
MRIAITGATGRVGYPVARNLAAQGHSVTTLGRRPVPGLSYLDWSLDLPPPDLSDFDALVHAAFAHVPGRYRGGEGDDPAGFRALNLNGTLRLFAHAKSSGVARIVFLSSRAVYDGYSPGTVLADGLSARPATLYAEVKAEAEAWLTGSAGPSLAVASLRATGVYGAGVPGQPHKWDALFAAHLSGQVQPARVGSEVHEDDIAAAVGLLLTVPPGCLAPVTFNASDILLDHHDLLACVNDLTGKDRPLPKRSDPAMVGVMTTDRLRDLGWTPRGLSGLRPTVAALLTGST